VRGRPCRLGARDTKTGSRSFAIKKPSPTRGNGRRSTFAVQEVRESGRNTLPLESVDAINAAFLKGDIDRNEAERQVEEVRAGLYRERDASLPHAVFSSENNQLLDRYWHSEFSERELVDAESMLSDLRRAVAACGIVSLLAASRQDLQTEINERYLDNPTKQRRVVSRLNPLLRFAGRDFKLRKMKPVRPEPLYLSEADLNAVLPHLPSDHLRKAARAAYLTGCRLGELYGLTERSIKTDHLLVSTQLDDDLKRRETKTRSLRKVFMLPGGEEAVREFLAIPADERSITRKLRHSTLFKRACRKAFPKDSSKHCRFHDLRHSYAVSLISKGAPLTIVAQSLGNSTFVCERYYSGFVMREESFSILASLFKV